MIIMKMLWNDSWLFTKEAGLVENNSKVLETEKWEAVNLPHSWNEKDGQDGGNDYYRGTCYYAKKLALADCNGAEEVYIEFEGANSSADVYVNGKLAVHHDGADGKAEGTSHRAGLRDVGVAGYDDRAPADAGAQCERAGGSRREVRRERGLHVDSWSGHRRAHPFPHPRLSDDVRSIIGDMTVVRCCDNQGNASECDGPWFMGLSRLGSGGCCPCGAILSLLVFAFALYIGMRRRDLR